jgi:hypothetical protein
VFAQVDLALVWDGGRGLGDLGVEGGVERRRIAFGANRSLATGIRLHGSLEPMCRLANAAVVMEFTEASAEVDMGTRKP